MHLGQFAYDEGDRAAARARFAECLAILEHMGDHRTLASCLEILAALAADGQSFALAVRLAARAAALRRSTGSSPPPIQAARLAEALATARQALGTATSAEWEAGAGLSFADTRTEALALFDEDDESRPGAPSATEPPRRR